MHPAYLSNSQATLHLSEHSSCLAPPVQEHANTDICIASPSTDFWEHAARSFHFGMERGYGAG